MIERIRPDFSIANRELDELVSLSERFSFDLTEYLRLLGQARAPVYAIKINEEVTTWASGRVASYQLSQGMLAILVALRARNGEQNGI